MSGQILSFRKNLFRSPQGGRRPRTRLNLEQLETRNLPSAFAPRQIRQAYRINQAGYDGSGQTIAIVDAYNAPNIAGDLSWFSTVYGLPQANLQVVNQYGGSWLPAYNRGWSDEISADVEWAHAVVPGAKILLVEANSNWYSDLLAAVDYAAVRADVVSMSWGGAEFPAETSGWYDGRFANHPGVTFLTSAGDLGAPAGWPGVSPNVISVGGTSLTTQWDGTYVGETGWGYGTQSSRWGGSGGGISLYEPQPAYQWPVWQSSTQRTNPDVAFVADPNTGLSVYNSTTWGWEIFGGTSLGAPAWAGLIAMADQGRTASGRPTLSSAQALDSLYSMPWSNFHDITTGNNGYPAGWGYDLVTGLGTPVADRVVNWLIAYRGSNFGFASFSWVAPTGGGAVPNGRLNSRGIVQPMIEPIAPPDFFLNIPPAQAAPLAHEVGIGDPVPSAPPTGPARLPALEAKGAEVVARAFAASSGAATAAWETQDLPADWPLFDEPLQTQN
jgi:subtilase family serine protease